MRDYHIFRGGQQYETSGDSVKKYYEDVIKTCREEREKNKGDKTTSRTTADSLIGKRVSVSGDVWGLSSDDYYIGVIGRSVKFVRNGRRVTGHEVKWSDGVTERWLGRDLKPHVVDVTNEDPEFDDSKWKLKSKVSVTEDVEEGAEYNERPADLYVSVSDDSRVCLYFGGNEYEGIGVHVYRLNSDGMLFDGDGDEIKYTTIHTTHPDPSPDTHTVTTTTTITNTIVSTSTTTKTNTNTRHTNTNKIKPHDSKTNKLPDPCREQLIELGECYLSDGDGDDDYTLTCDNV